MAKKENLNEETKNSGKADEHKETKKAEEKDQAETNGAETTANQDAESELSETDALKKQVRMLEEESSYLKDQLLRKQAEFENFRKRLLKEKDESVKYANQMLLLDLTAIIDDFERAMKSAEDSRDFTAFHNGVVLIEKQLVTMLERQWGIKRFEPLGEAFDPDRHLSIAVEESPDQSFTVVTEVFQKGYLFYDRVLRPAKVKVVKPSGKEEAAEATDKPDNA